MTHEENQPTRRAIILTGGRLGGWALEEILPGDYLIGADSGADYLVQHGIAPDLALGDFDSVPANRLPLLRESAAEWLAVDAVAKDCTDTEMAVRQALDRGYNTIRIAGGLGTRFDHSLANVHLLRLALVKGCEAVMIDSHNEIRLCNHKCRIQADSRYPYVSLLPLTSIVRGVTLTGFQYPLQQATIEIGQSVGISNVLIAPVGTVELAEGELLVIRSRD